MTKDESNRNYRAKIKALCEKNGITVDQYNHLTPDERAAMRMGLSVAGMQALKEAEHLEYEAEKKRVLVLLDAYLATGVEIGDAELIQHLSTFFDENAVKAVFLTEKQVPFFSTFPTTYVSAEDAYRMYVLDGGELSRKYFVKLAETYLSCRYLKGGYKHFKRVE